MNSSVFVRTARLLVAGALVAALVSCGGGNSESSNRDSGRNAALDCGTDTSVATSDSTATDSTVAGNECSPDTTFASQKDSTEVKCDVTWDPASKAITFCDNFTKFDVAQYDDADKLITGTDQSFEDEKGGNQISVEPTTDAARIEVKVYAIKSGDTTKSVVGKVDFKPTESGTSSFTYSPASTTDSTVPSSDTTAPAAGDTSVPASDSTVPSSDSTAQSQSVTETTVPTIVNRESCDFTYVASTKSITSCKEFDRFSVATYGTDGKYSGRFEGEGAAAQIPDSIVSGGGLGFAHFEVATDIDALDLELYIADGWLTIGDGTKDVTTTVLLEDANKPSLNTYGSASNESVTADNNVIQFSRQFMLIDRDGTPIRNERFNIDWAGTTTWRAFLPDGFGIGRYVASGIIPAEGYEAESFTVYDPLEILSTQTVEVATGATGDGTNQFIDDVISNAEQDPCIGISPVLVMTPQSPSGANRVTLSMDSDCASSKHFMGVVIAAKSDSLAFWWMDLNITYASFMTTRYSTSIDETIYLPDGDYVIMFGSLGSIAFTDYTVNGHGSRADCNSAHVKVNAARKIGQLEGCTAGEWPWVSFSVSDTPFSWGMEVPYVGGDIMLDTVPYSGYFYAMAVGFQDTFWGYYTPFLMCLRNCDNPPNGSAAFDLTNYSNNGTVIATDSECTDGVEWNEALYWHQYKGGYAYEYTTSGPTGQPTVVHRNGKNIVQFSCVMNNSNGWSSTVRAVSLNITKKLPAPPANDDFANAIDLTPNEWTYTSNVNASSEAGEPVTAWMGNNPHIAQASVWYRYTPVKDQWVGVNVSRDNFASMFRVFRGSKVSKLGYVTGRYCNDWENDLCWDQFGFGAKAGNTYYIQVSGEWHTEQGTAALFLATQNQQPDAPDTTAVGSGGPDTTVAGAPDTTVPSSSSSPDVTTGDTTDTTVAGTITTTTVAAASTTTVGSTDTTIAGGADTTVPAGSDGARDAALNETFASAARDSSNNEKASVILASKEDTPSVEVRDNTATVEIPAIDLWATLSSGGDTPATNMPVTVYLKGHRPVVMPPRAKAVSIPIGAEVSEASIVGTSTENKPITATMKIKRVLKPIFKVKGSGGNSDSSSTGLYAGIGAAVLLLLLAFFLVKRRKEGEETAEQA